MKNLYISLVHYPVYNKNGEIVVSAITNLDIHDIARASKTFDAAGYFIINPSEDQCEIASKVIDHWKTGYGATYNKDRKDAVDLIELLPNIKSAISIIESERGVSPLVIATSAKGGDDILTISQLKTTLYEENKPVLLLLGTGHGMAMEQIPEIDRLLEPINGGEDGYNHLSVRSAASIYLYLLKK
ncbi:RNA methyltransferase [bacterium]|nr:RNA methyltransferase [bacterium]